MQKLTLEMIVKKKKNAKPKLKTKGAEMRNLVPIISQLAEEFHGHMDTVKSKAILDLFSRLMDFYMISSMYDDFSPELMEKSITEFCLIYRALAYAPDNKAWYLKPKLHMFQELAMEAFDAGNPTNYWTYKDEDFMGIISKMSTSRGGGRNPATIPENVCVRYAAK